MYNINYELYRYSQAKTIQNEIHIIKKKMCQSIRKMCIYKDNNYIVSSV